MNLLNSNTANNLITMIERIKERRYRKSMNNFQFIYNSIITCFLIMLSACSASNKTYFDEQENPYIYNKKEFKRVNFVKPIKEPNFITICYNKNDILPESIYEMASKECAKYNKIAEFVRQSYLICPIFNPIAVIYNCCPSIDEVTKNTATIQNSKENKCSSNK